ncbi:nitroreductase family protein [Nocardioides sp. NPDC127503]|uniref:nitroreductase family protein n=1 Tax=Nocardioides sp. NPDC127503 TaxID=3154516 RepID=UPI0033270464
MTAAKRAPQAGAEDLTEHLRDRWSVSVFDPAHELADAEIRLLLEAARWAPSAGNSQPWSFLVLPRGSAGHATFVSHLSRGNSGWVPRASAVFVAVSQVGVGPDGNGPKWSDYSHYDLGQAAAHLTVQAASLGLSSHQFAGFDHDAVAATFGVPDWWKVMTGIAVGRHGDPTEVDPRDAEREERERIRRPLEETAFADKWGTPWA